MSAPSDLFLVANLQTGALVSFNGSASSLPALWQYNTRNLRLQFVNPNPTTLPLGSSSYSPQNLNGYLPRVAITPTPTGTGGGPAVLAIQTVFVWDNTNQWFTGSLALNTSAVDSFIAAAASATAHFEITLIQPDATRFTAFGGPVTLNAAGDEGTSTVPTPTAQYLTADEIKALFVPRIMAAGDVIQFISPDGTKKAELGLANDSTWSTNYVS